MSVLDDEVELLFEVFADSEGPRLLQKLESISEGEPLPDELVAHIDEALHQELERDLSPVTPNTCNIHMSQRMYESL